MSKNLLVLLALTSVLVACSLPKPRYGLDYNADRLRIGLPAIPSNWKPALVDGGESTWLNPDGEEKLNKRIPVYFSKYLDYRTGTLTSETDTYYGKQDFTTLGDTLRERLNITYTYPNPRGTAVYWIVSLESQDTANSGEDRISLEKADKILQGWGISRPTGTYP